MLSKEAINKIGMLDESLGNGFFEDTDFCWRAEDAGLKVIQVPTNDVHYDGQNYIGNFPIYHQGHATFKEMPDEKRACWFANKKTIEERYGGVNLERAKKCDGYMADQELDWLARQAKKHKVILECGSWHGRSTRALGDNTLGAVYAIDHFNGSKTEPQNHGSARLEDGDHAFMEFMDNNLDLVQNGKIIPLRGTTKSMAKLLKRNGVKADMIFIDAGHTYEEVKEDITTFKEILASKGLLCGHDYQSWAGVTQAVNELIPNKKVGQNTSIWYTENKGKIYDCFPFFNELDLLEVRLNELNDVVDYFVIAEANVTHSGKSKPFNFEENKKIFEKFKDKIIYIKVEDMPKINENGNDAWTLERFQRDALTRGLTNCTDEDVLLISDADEIPAADFVKNYSIEQGPKWLKQSLYYYYLNCRVPTDWNQAKIIPYKTFKQGYTPCKVRYAEFEMADNAGWHFSYLGGTERVIQKIESFAHQEYNTTEIKNKINLEDRIQHAQDLYGRPGATQMKIEKIDGSYPKFIQKNEEYFNSIGLIK
jgi:beta-1,4-mannosyl-glycoprotein beta-1,4-N-acetylglucosaminyltransferase